MMVVGGRGGVKGRENDKNDKKNSVCCARYFRNHTSYDCHFKILIFWAVTQAFRNYVHGYNPAHNVHANGVMHTRKFVHGIASSVKII